MATAEQLIKSYATFGINRSLRQIQHAMNGRQRAAASMQALYRWVQEQEAYMVELLGQPIEGMDILEIGPGQGLERARYFGMKNRVTGVDLDVIPVGFDPKSYLHIFKENGAGRFLKTVGRQLIIGGANARAWATVTGAKQFRNPTFIHGDICGDLSTTLPTLGTYDLAMSWSVFEHLPDPRQALANLIDALEPGGLLFLSIHLYTSNNGHHDIRAFTGGAETLPLWGHLRPAHQAQIVPSAYLNKWRLADWRALFTELTPGHQEILEVFETRQRLEPKMTAALRKELADYSDEELYSVNALYLWRKPA